MKTVGRVATCALFLLALSLMGAGADAGEGDTRTSVFHVEGMT